MLEFAKMGAICELDLFGTEVSYYQLSDDFDMPNDATRIAEVKQLVDEGYGDMVTISHDIHTKHRLVSSVYVLSHHSLTSCFANRCAMGVMVFLISCSMLFQRCLKEVSPASRLIKY